MSVCVSRAGSKCETQECCSWVLLVECGKEVLGASEWHQDMFLGQIGARGPDKRSALSRYWEMHNCAPNGILLNLEKPFFSSGGPSSTDRSPGVTDEQLTGKSVETQQAIAVWLSML